MQTQIRLAPEALNFAAGVGLRIKILAVPIPLMHQSSSLALISYRAKNNCPITKGEKPQSDVNLNHCASPKKKKETDPPPFFCEAAFLLGQSQGRARLAGL